MTSSQTSSSESELRVGVHFSNESTDLDIPGTNAEFIRQDDGTLLIMVEGVAIWFSSAEALCQRISKSFRPIT